jgi:hypothetical protein
VTKKRRQFASTHGPKPSRTPDTEVDFIESEHSDLDNHDDDDDDGGGGGGGHGDGDTKGKYLLNDNDGHSEKAGLVQNEDWRQQASDDDDEHDSASASASADLNTSTTSEPGLLVLSQGADVTTGEAQDKRKSLTLPLGLTAGLCSLCKKTPTNPKTLATCRHVFCTSCVDHWLTEHSSCPKCKQPQGAIFGDQPG